MKHLFAVKPTYFTVFLFIFLQHFRVGFAQECTLCTEEAPVRDCVDGDDPPFQGGSSCYCVAGALLAGCVLKPCGNQQYEREYCDSSAGYGNGDASLRINAFAHKCTLKGGCECCNSYPKDCKYDNLNNPPTNGGPPCSCVSGFAVPGCTLKVCLSSDATNCVCNERFSGSLSCFRSSCPGNANATLVGECSALPPTTTTPTTTTTSTNSSTTTNGTNPPTTTNVSNPPTTTNVTNPPTTTKPSNPPTTTDGGSGADSVIASISILLASIAVSYI